MHIFLFFLQAASVSVPWKALLTSLPVWAFVMANFSFNWGFYTFAIELPSFVTQQLKFDIATVSFAYCIVFRDNLTDDYLPTFSFVVFFGNDPFWQLLTLRRYTTRLYC